MTPSFDTSLWGTSTTGTWLTCLAFTLPPASAGTSYTFNISSGAIQSFTIPDGMTWASGTLTIPSTFTATQSTVTLTLSSGASASFSINLSGSPQSGTATALQMNADGWMYVTTLGSGVTFTGFTPLIQSVPEDGAVSLQDALFMIPQVSGTPDFSFLITNPAKDGTVSLVSSSNSQVAVDSSTQTATAQSALGPGETATVTVTYTPNGGSEVSGIFTVQRLSKTSIPSGGQSSLLIAQNNVFSVSSIAPKALLRGSDVQFLMPSGSCDLDFNIAQGGIDYASQPVSFQNTTGSTSATFTSSSPATGVVQIADEGTQGVQTGFTLATDAGTWDPTIINDPDDGPVPVSDTRKTEA